MGLSPLSPSVYLIRLLNASRRLLRLSDAPHSVRLPALLRHDETALLSQVVVAVLLDKFFQAPSRTNNPEVYANFVSV